MASRTNPDSPFLSATIYDLYRDFFDQAERKRRWRVKEDIPWDQCNPAVNPAAADVVESFCAVELYLPDYLGKILPHFNDKSRDQILRLLKAPGFSGHIPVSEVSLLAESERKTVEELMVELLPLRPRRGKVDQELSLSILTSLSFLMVRRSKLMDSSPVWLKQRSVRSMKKAVSQGAHL